MKKAFYGKAPGRMIIQEIERSDSAFLEYVEANYSECMTTSLQFSMFDYLELESKDGVLSQKTKTMEQSILISSWRALLAEYGGDKDMEDVMREPIEMLGRMMFLARKTMFEKTMKRI